MKYVQLLSYLLMIKRIYLIGLLVCLSHAVTVDENGLWTLEETTQVAEDSFLASGVSKDKSTPGIGSVFFGFFLFFIAFPILWYNERRYKMLSSCRYLVTQFRIHNAFKVCKTVDSSEIDKRAEGCLAFTNGFVSTEDVIADATFGIEESNSIKLTRSVEMLQWVESRHESDNKVHYDYSLEWRASHVNSSSFHSSHGHTNESSLWVVHQQTFTAPTVRLGLYKINESMKEQTRNYEQVPVTQANADLAKNSFSSTHQFMQLENSMTSFTSESHILMRQNMHETSGDLRISFKKVPCQGFTLVAQATEDTFRPWKIIDKYNEESVDELRESGNHHHIFPGCCSAICECVKVIESPMSDIEWIFEEVLKKTQAFNKKLDFNARLTTGIRLGGWLLMAVGLIIAFSPIAYIISLFPLLGNFLGSLTSFFFTLLSFALATPSALLAISIAWLWYRPQIAIIMILGASSIFFLVYYWITIYSSKPPL